MSIGFSSFGFCLFNELQWKVRHKFNASFLNWILFSKWLESAPNWSNYEQTRHSIFVCQTLHLQKMCMLNWSRNHSLSLGRSSNLKIMNRSQSLFTRFVWFYAFYRQKKSGWLRLEGLVDLYKHSLYWKMNLRWLEIS